MWARLRRSARCATILYSVLEVGGAAASTFTETTLKTTVAEFSANLTYATAEYGPISDWDVSAITDMRQLFDFLSDFNADISAWNTSSVTDMDSMFQGASAFNQALSFDTSSVMVMHSMFQGASAFDQPLSFNTSSLTNVNHMFRVRPARTCCPISI